MMVSEDVAWHDAGTWRIAWPTIPAQLIRRPLRIWRAFIVPLLLLGLWQYLVERGVYTRSQLPAPLDVYRAARQLAAIDELWIHVQISSQRVAEGFLIGSLVAIGLGLLVGLSRLADELLTP